MFNNLIMGTNKVLGGIAILSIGSHSHTPGKTWDTSSSSNRINLYTINNVSTKLLESITFELEWTQYDSGLWLKPDSDYGDAEFGNLDDTYNENVRAWEEFINEMNSEGLDFNIEVTYKGKTYTLTKTAVANYGYQDIEIKMVDICRSMGISYIKGKEYTFDSITLVSPPIKGKFNQYLRQAMMGLKSSSRLYKVKLYYSKLKGIKKIETNNIPNGTSIPVNILGTPITLTWTTTEQIPPSGVNAPNHNFIISAVLSDSSGIYNNFIKPVDNSAVKGIIQRIECWYTGIRYNFITITFIPEGGSSLPLTVTLNGTVNDPNQRNDPWYTEILAYTDEKLRTTYVPGRMESWIKDNTSSSYTTPFFILGIPTNITPKR